MSFRNFVLGMGVGIIIVSVMGLIVSPHLGKTVTEKVTMSDEEIIDRGKELGLVDAADVTAVEQTTEAQSVEVQSVEVQSVEQTTLGEREIIEQAKGFGMVFADEIAREESTTDNQASSDPNEFLSAFKIGETETFFTIKVKDETSAKDISKLLFDMHLIDNVEQFEKLMGDNGLSSISNAGYYSFEKGSSKEQIINVLNKPQ